MSKYLRTFLLEKSKGSKERVASTALLRAVIETCETITVNAVSLYDERPINKRFNISPSPKTRVSGFEHRYDRHVDLGTGSSRPMKSRQQQAAFPEPAVARSLL